jgi:hypothetical protein
MRRRRLARLLHWLRLKWQLRGYPNLRRLVGKKGRMTTLKTR